MLAVAEAARNVACAGGQPIGATNCLNFGNPERPEIMWQFAQAVDGIAEACKALEIPITGGNVSLYNETDGQAIFPTPILGVVGLIENATTVIGRIIRRPGAIVVQLGDGCVTLGGSEYLKVSYGLIRGLPPDLDLDAERALQALLVRAVADGLIDSAHDCAEGGLAVTLAECSFDAGGLGLEIDVAGAPGFSDEWTAPATLFGERAGTAVVSTSEDRLSSLLALAARLDVRAVRIGVATGERLRMAVGGQRRVDVSVREAETVWSSAIERYFTRQAA
jgi:phosphoribosylformylglycinamidine synthase